jgi:hypothetical protein
MAARVLVRQRPAWREATAEPEAAVELMATAASAETEAMEPQAWMDLQG